MAESPPNLARTTRGPVERLGVSVVQDLVDAIVTGQVSPGTALPAEAVLSEQFGVSRTVIRESVKRLDEKGLVDVGQGRSTVVRDSSAWNVMDPVVLSALVAHDDSLHVLDDLVWTRNALEGEMAARAAIRAQAEDLAELRRILDRAAASRHEPEAFMNEDLRFHAKIMRIADARLLRGIAQSLVDHAIQSSRYLGARRRAEWAPPEPAIVTATIAEHERIYRAIADGDAEEAQRAVQEHIEIAWERRRIADTPEDDADG